MALLGLNGIPGGRDEAGLLLLLGGAGPRLQGDTSAGAAWQEVLIPRGSLHGEPPALRPCPRSVRLPQGFSQTPETVRPEAGPDPPGQQKYMTPAKPAEGARAKVFGSDTLLLTGMETVTHSVSAY